MNILLIAAFFVFSAAAFGQSKTDIHCRPALYFGKGILEPQPMNKNSRYVAAGKKIELSKDEAVNQANGKYYFTVLYILYGTPQKDALALGEFTNRLKIGSEILNQHQVKFTNTDRISNDTIMTYVRTTIALPLGESVVTLSLDDGKIVKEANENNNTYSFNIVVNGKM